MDAADRSFGWDAVAHEFVALRSRVGVEVLRRWVRRLPTRPSVIDIGCGAGVPVSEVLLAEGCKVAAIDASPRLVATFRANFPDVEIACEAAEDSRFFGRTFDAGVAIGLMFLLPAVAQARVIAGAAAAINPGGRFLFTSPREPCNWVDSLTGRPSMSLGLRGYEDLLSGAGFSLAGVFQDEGQNTYFDAVKA